MSKKVLQKPLFSDTLKKKPKKLIMKKNPYNDILLDKYSGSMGGDKKLAHKRDRRDNRFIIEEDLLEEDLLEEEE